MTRIIGGTAGGRRLRTPVGDATRPTSDRVREAVFSMLESAIGPLEGLRFLDLYAGSGAVGLEARSRGASYVMVVEQDRRTAALIRENARTLDLDGVDVSQQPVSRFLAGTPGTPYDVVFLDPPYPMPAAEVDEELARLQSNGWLAEGAVVVVERSVRGREPEWEGEPFVLRKYGETAIWLGRA